MSDVAGTIGRAGSGVSGDAFAEKAKAEGYVRALHQASLNGLGLNFTGNASGMIGGWMPEPETDEGILSYLQQILAQQDESHRRQTAALRRIVEILGEKITLPQGVTLPPTPENDGYQTGD